jgi:hypothetical protein
MKKMILVFFAVFGYAVMAEDLMQVMHKAITNNPSVKMEVPALPHPDLGPSSTEKFLNRYQSLQSELNRQQQGRQAWKASKDKQYLLMSVAAAYFQTLEAQEHWQAQVQKNSAQINETNSLSNDVAINMSIDLGLWRAKKALQNSQELLKNLSGEGPSSLAPVVIKDDVTVPDPEKKTTLVQQALDNNLELKWTSAKVEESLVQLKKMKAERYPYFVWYEPEKEVRPDPRYVFPSDRYSEGGIIRPLISIPLGGHTSGRQRQELRAQYQAEYDLYKSRKEQLIDQIMVEVSIAFDRMEASAKALNSLPASAMNPVWRSQNSYDYILNFLKLKYLEGTLGLQDLQQINGEWLDREHSVKIGP